MDGIIVMGGTICVERDVLKKVIDAATEIGMRANEGSASKFYTEMLTLGASGFLDLLSAVREREFPECMCCGR